MPVTTTLVPDLLVAYRAVRSYTDALAAPLSSEDQCIQSMPDVSPTKWHRAHVTWFFETFLLKPHLDGYVDFDPAFGYLFNSYYETVGRRHPRPERGNLSRPSCAEVDSYRAYVDLAMAELLARSLDGPAADLVTLGLHHEQQHQELLLMDIKHVLSTNRALWPAYQELPESPPVSAVSAVSAAPGRSAGGWTRFAGGEIGVGHDGDGFAFDNESPRHRTILPSYLLADRLVTCGQWLEFMAAGGYETPTLWLSDGWHQRLEHRWEAPSYWDFHPDEGWRVFTLHGLQPLSLDEPVCHLSYYEADAFARWAGARLPTEAEWEHAAAGQEPRGNLGDRGRWHPVRAQPGSGLDQLYGDVWEWTSSPYGPYPGFRTAPGAVGEYNGKFMVNQFVLRGGACVTPPGHIRPTYRNFFHPHTRWHFSGLRLARDAA
ncbi:ergothioneine biosynthesis protein EgtB [Candidatus Poriferisocius sp.]|uniref:ergothioneine biosynthesis protein EgtB n=1 Tax=Candidatus Poriferisocius sp. TaxID=3101276 RepID=UPI003B019D9E